jgi:hypothetical protein
MILKNKKNNYKIIKSSRNILKILNFALKYFLIIYYTKICNLIKRFDSWNNYLLVIIYKSYFYEIFII